MVAFLGAATNWLLFAALLAALGSVAARWVFVPRAALSLPAARPELLASAGRQGLVAAGLLPVAMGLAFVRQLVEFRDPFSPWVDEAHLLLIGTEWGRTWLAATSITVLAVPAFVAARRGVEAGWLFGSLTVLGVGVYPAFSGHAAGAESLRTLAIGADVAHVLAAGAWVGGLLFVLTAERAWRRAARTDPASLLPVLVPAFSPVAIAAVATLVSSGVFASWVHLEGPGALVATPYGRLLTAKLVVVAAVLCLGAVNWRRLSPRLGSDAGDGALRRSATRELLLMHAVLAVTAVLVRTSPMGH